MDTWQIGPDAGREVAIALDHYSAMRVEADATLEWLQANHEAPQYAVSAVFKMRARDERNARRAVREAINRAFARIEGRQTKDEQQQSRRAVGNPGDGY